MTVGGRKAASAALLLLIFNDFGGELREGKRTALPDNTAVQEMSL